MSPYEQLAKELALDGIRCQFQRPGQMVVSNQTGPIWPDRGNSFWVTQVDGAWYLFTWANVGYAVLVECELASVCRECMEQGSTAMSTAPPDIVQRYDLRRLSDEDVDRVFAGMP